MKKTGYEIDWTWQPQLTEIDTVWFARTSDDSMLVASNPDFDALIIADSPEEIVEIAALHNPTTLTKGKVEVKPAVTTLHSLSTRWRWFIYKDAARFLCGANGWVPGSIAEYPGVQAGLAPDPMALVHYLRTPDGPLTNQGALVVGSDVNEILEEAELCNQNGDNAEFCILPLFVVAARYRECWFRGRKHDIVGALMRNVPLLAHHGMVDPKFAKELDNEN